MGSPLASGISRSQSKDVTAQITEHRYDVLGNRTQTILPTGEVLNRLYYGSGRLHHINLDGTTLADIERDALHRPVERTIGKLNTQFQLDPLGRLKQQIAQPNGHNKADPAVLIGRRYQYDTIGNLVRTDDQTNGSRDYIYDALGRITQSADEHYRYDPAHNLTDGSRISGNRLTQYKGISYRYDPLGNLVEKQQNDGKIQHYRYNADNQLTEAEIHCPGQNAVLYRYRYDPIGRRIAKVHPDGNEIQYLWDGSRLLQEYRKDRTYTYIYTEDRNYEPLAQITTYNGSDKAREILYYHNDQIGIPREMTDEEGNIVWSGDYSGWGKLTQEGRLKLDIHQPFRLQNQHYDEETGLHYNFFRYYDPEIGRFTQQDPIGLMGGGNLYVFAPNNQQWIDPLGLNSLAQCLNPANTIQCAEAGMISAPPVTAPTTVGGVTKGALATGTGIAAISISKVSPDAIALSNAHNSGQNYGGNCTPKEHRALTAMKMSFCNAPRSCQKKSLTDQSEIAVRESFALGCAQIRSKINNKCFAGGDQIHRDEEKEAWDVWATCRAKLKL
ncbi:hypothetical protein HMPREF3050_11380 [Neisseria sp. HMSC065D04]|nr:hypothetical protein HMPREF3050_11380 [Neisseria sp. HMSC065D04]